MQCSNKRIFFALHTRFVYFHNGLYVQKTFLVFSRFGFYFTETNYRTMVLFIYSSAPLVRGERKACFHSHRGTPRSFSIFYFSSCASRISCAAQCRGRAVDRRSRSTLPTNAPFLTPKKDSSVLPPLSLGRAYRVIDRYAEQTQFLIKSWVYGRGLKVFIYVYLPLHAP